MKPVVIVGGGISGLSAAWELQQQDVPYIVLEASGRLGGKIITEHTPQGFVLEGAADSFLTAKPWAAQLCQELGLEEHLIPTNPHRKAVYVLRDGRLHPMPPGLRLLVPTDPAGLMHSELLSDEGKWRMLSETEAPVRQQTGDESLASFVRRRFGQEALDVFGEPLLSGIYTADPEQLSIEATFPQYPAFERKYGSVIRGTIETSASYTSASASSAFVSLNSGVHEIIDALQNRLTGEVRLESPVRAILPDKTVVLQNRVSLEASAVILAIPAKAAAPLVQESAPEVALELSRFKAISSAVVWLGYPSAQVSHPLDGYGFVVVASEPTSVRAGTWSSTKLAGRAPDGHVLIRFFFGGHRHESDVFRPDEELLQMAQQEAARLLGIEAAPELRRVFRWLESSPLYEVNHLRRLEWIEQRRPGWLQLCGASYRGVGIPDCVRQGREAARNAIKA
jgi:oxygen-dependent protoporphyrinogen oxidase